MNNYQTFIKNCSLNKEKPENVEEIDEENKNIVKKKKDRKLKFNEIFENKYPHKMYKGKIVKTARNEKEHKKLMKDGYNHTKLKTYN